MNLNFVLRTRPNVNREDVSQNFIIKPVFPGLLIWIILFSSYNGTTSDKIPNLIGSSTLVENDTKDESFESFLKHFNSDSTFQVSRINFPFEHIISGIEDEKDSIRLIQAIEFEKMEFSKKENNNGYDKWKQTVKSGLDTTSIQIRGIDNGIFIDYYFRKEKGKWWFIRVVDSST